ncbi:MAG: permease prefix domain 1-containing protein [Candidatus Helarchaeota archaeon]
MREIDEANRLINEFLAEVELRLPSWLKIREEELDEVLQELKEHIEDKAQSFVDQGMAYIEAIKKSITEMGNPVEIANEYKKRGTPKYYITVELWNLYIKSLKLILALIIPIMSIFIALDVVITIFHERQKSISQNLSSEDIIFKKLKEKLIRERNLKSARIR